MKEIRSTVINGDEGARAPAGTGVSSSASAPAPSPAAAGLAAAVEKATAEHQASKALADKPKTPVGAPVQPAFNEPATNAATPRDEHHGKGGEYHIVDGQRVRVEPKL